MIFARFGPASDVYVYDAGDVGNPLLTCGACIITPVGPDDEPRDFTCVSYFEMAVHLHAHRHNGDVFPEDVFALLFGAASSYCLTPRAPRPRPGVHVDDPQATAPTRGAVRSRRDA